MPPFRARGAADVSFWLRLLKNSAGKCRHDLHDLFLQGTAGPRDRLYGSTRRQDWILGPSAGPFISMIHAGVQWAINFEQCACRGVLQQPRLRTDLCDLAKDVCFQVQSGITFPENAIQLFAICSHCKIGSCRWIANTSSKLMPMPCGSAWT